jgi:hypothetical protein
MDSGDLKEIHADVCDCGTGEARLEGVNSISLLGLVIAPLDLLLGLLLSAEGKMRDISVCQGLFGVTIRTSLGIHLPRTDGGCARHPPT